MEEEKISCTEATPPPMEPMATPEQKAEIEKEQELKLKSKFPGMPSRPMPGSGGGVSHSAFLQKRLTKGQKYFDSGDYQMAQQKQGRVGSGRMAMPILAQAPTGEAHPTPATVPARKTSIIQPMHSHLQPHLPPGVEPGKPLPNPAVAKLST